MELTVFPSHELEAELFKKELYREKLFVEQHDIDRKFYGCQPNQINVKKYTYILGDVTRLLVYHTMGSGKTDCAALSVANYINKFKRNIILCKGDSSTISFKNNVNEWLARYKKDIDLDKFKYEHFQIFANANLAEEVYNSSLIVIDEIHNIRNQDTTATYTKMLAKLSSVRNATIVAMTGTPMYDSAHELGELMQLIAAGDEGVNIPISYYSEQNANIPRFEYVSKDPVPTGNEYTCVFLVPKYKDKFIRVANEGNDGFYKFQQTLSFINTDDYRKSASAVHEKYFTEDNFFKFEYYKYIRDIKDLGDVSVKIKYIIELIESHPGELVYIYYDMVMGFGIHWIANVIRARINMKNKKLLIIDAQTDYADDLAVFNSPENKHGQFIPVIIGSSVSGEALTLKNIRHVVIVAPHWNSKKIKQAETRAVRFNAHADIGDVGVKIHLLVCHVDGRGIDIEKYNKSYTKEQEINLEEQRLQAMSLENYPGERTGERWSTHFYYCRNEYAEYVDDYASRHDMFTLHQASTDMNLDEGIVFAILRQKMFYNGIFFSHTELLQPLDSLPTSIVETPSCDFGFAYRSFMECRDDYERVCFISEHKALVVTQVLRMFLEQPLKNRIIKYFFDNFYTYYEGVYYEVSTISSMMNAQYAGNKPIDERSYYQHIYFLDNGWHKLTDPARQAEIGRIMCSKYYRNLDWIGVRKDQVYVSNGRCMFQNIDSRAISKYGSIRGMNRGIYINNLTKQERNAYMFRALIDSVNQRFVNNLNLPYISMAEFMDVMSKNYTFHPRENSAAILREFIEKHRKLATVLYLFAKTDCNVDFFLRIIYNSEAFVLRP